MSNKRILPAPIELILELIRVPFDKKILRDLILNRYVLLKSFIEKNDTKLKYDEWKKKKAEVDKAVKAQKFNEAANLRTEERKFAYQFAATIQNAQEDLFDTIVFDLSDLNTHYQMCQVLFDVLFEQKE